MAVQSTDLMIVERAGTAYQTTAGAVAGLGGGGGATLSGTATITLPDGRGHIEHTQTVAAVGIVPANTIAAFFAAGLDEDENNAELLDPACNPVAVAGTDEITITATFREPTSGPVKIIWKVL